MAESLRALRMFVALYEERSFTAAATREFATQSGVSQQIRKLEDRLGVALVERGPGVCRPTPAGDAFYARCVKVLQANAEGEATVKRFSVGLEGQLTIGMVPVVTRSVLAGALAEFVGAHPNVAVAALEGDAPELLARVRARELDFAVVPASSRKAELQSRPLVRTPAVLVAGLGFRGRTLRHLQPISLKNAGPLKVVVPGSSDSRRKSIEDYLAACGARIERKLELDSFLGTLDLVARSDWVSLQPGIILSPGLDGEQLTMHPLADPPQAATMAVMEPLQRTHPQAVDAFVELLRASARRVSVALEAADQQHGVHGMIGSSR